MTVAGGGPQLMQQTPGGPGQCSWGGVLTLGGCWTGGSNITVTCNNGVWTLTDGAGHTITPLAVSSQNPIALSGALGGCAFTIQQSGCPSCCGGGIPLTLHCTLSYNALFTNCGLTNNQTATATYAGITTSPFTGAVLWHYYGTFTGTGGCQFDFDFIIVNVSGVCFSSIGQWSANTCITGAQGALLICPFTQSTVNVNLGCCGCNSINATITAMP